eukprot:1160567-Pelagomonas_calceolata.AAC.4
MKVKETMTTMVTMGVDLQPGRLADRLVAGTDKQIESSLNVVKKVASQEYPGSKVQKALDTCGAQNKRVHQYS